MRDKAFNILLVEDDEIDVENIKRSLSKANITNPLILAGDGLEALEILQKGGIGPIVVLLDLKMPRMGGLEFLHRIRSDERWKNLPVVVLTSSKEEKDLIEAYKMNVAGYVVKPLIFADFVEAVTKIGSYWTLCELPGK
jgi:CheY-like chemotaxis protein